MSRLTNKFKANEEKSKKSLIAYLTAGDPNLDTSYKLVLELERAGVDIIELGIPHSDPLADGPVIQRASKRALESGTGTKKVFELVENIRSKSSIPLVLLSYYNSILQYGLENFVAEAHQKGVDGLIVPDLPLEEQAELKEVLKAYPLDLIPLVAPTSQERIQKIVEGSSGFIYCVSSLGVTGSRKELDQKTLHFINEVKKFTETPLALGFGISSPQMIQSLDQLPVSIIVGSALIEKIEEGISEGDLEKRVFDFAKSLADSLAPRA